MKRIAVATALLWLFSGAGSALAQAPLLERFKALQSDPAALRDAAAAGKGAAAFCANCHGADGNASEPEVPNLAGQNGLYLIEQMRKFATGERKNAFMQGLIKKLTDAERVQIAAFYAEARVRPGPAEAALAPRGKELYSKLCQRCHGDSAHGTETIPRLAGQRRDYLETSILRYRNGTGERIYPLMAIATSPLTNPDIKAVAAYLAALDR